MLRWLSGSYANKPTLCWLKAWNRIYCLIWLLLSSLFFMHDRRNKKPSPHHRFTARITASRHIDRRLKTISSQQTCQDLYTKASLIANNNERKNKNRKKQLAALQVVKEMRIYLLLCNDGCIMMMQCMPQQKRLTPKTNSDRRWISFPFLALFTSKNAENCDVFISKLGLRFSLPAIINHFILLLFIRFVRRGEETFIDQLAIVFLLHRSINWPSHPKSDSMTVL